MKRVVAVTDRGLRVGEDHQNAKLTDAEVDNIRELREAHGFSYSLIADWFGVSKSTIAMVCRYERRAEVASEWKTIRD